MMQQFHTQEYPAANRNYKDRLFRFVFNYKDRLFRFVFKKMCCTFP